MPHRKIIEDYYCDINNLAGLLSTLVNSYRLLIGGAGELNSIALAHKKDIKDALGRVQDLGDVIDKVINVLDKSSCCYLDYCKIKSQIIECRMQAEYIQTEIDEELFLNNIDRDEK